jgi:hypothetical protein
MKNPTSLSRWGRSIYAIGLDGHIFQPVGTGFSGEIQAFERIVDRPSRFPGVPAEETNVDNS